jgi:uncharacterized protein (TIGR00255 family)
MSGFGQAELRNARSSLTVEIISLNHRYLEISVPKEFSFYECEIKKQVNKYLKRGKVNISILYEDLRKNPYQIKVNEALFTSLKAWAKKLTPKSELTLADLLNIPELVKIEKKSESRKVFLNDLKVVLNKALKNLVEARKKEGVALERGVKVELEKIKGWVKKISQKGKQMKTNYQRKLQNRLKNFLLDEEKAKERLELEIALLLERGDITEEVVRMNSLLKEATASFNLRIPVGKKLNFLTQELFREINTIQAKSTDRVIKSLGLKIKNSLEKMREQIQNVE